MQGPPASSDQSAVRSPEGNLNVCAPNPFTFAFRPDARFAVLSCFLFLVVSAHGRMKLLGVVLVAAALAVAESVMDFSKLPACAENCAVLKNADAGCVPPAAPVTDQGTYQSCVCASTLLTSLHSSGALCQAFCSADDSSTISQYYNSLCKGPVVYPSTSTSASASTSTSASATTSTATAGAAGTGPMSSPAHTSWYVGRGSHGAIATILTLFAGGPPTGGGFSWPLSSSWPSSSSGL
ncbi:hypothetical protein K491DRAFT_45497 [Lophiostoma macrostomum CBS 122681]|uniref:CFEM domain-containing protein n=1 Tax=Lophiostoma macrostomum CBS 122681 TaxID=1314788 RepID=A0A6A6SYB7_9PLEO|nr:hypothetical protein K491DRAFT_45497 [Lophiostoma macrostomum CBS 122681]